MERLDKLAIGRRILEIRKHADLRQWELAKLLETTQSAVHKYERGVIPEPSRLIRLATIGGTSADWILTGSHGPGGPTQRELPYAETIALAIRIGAFGEKEQHAVSHALSILEQCAAAAEEQPAADAQTAHHLLSSARNLVQKVNGSAAKTLATLMDRVAQAG